MIKHEKSLKQWSTLKKKFKAPTLFFRRTLAFASAAISALVLSVLLAAAVEGTAATSGTCRAALASPPPPEVGFPFTASPAEPRIDDELN